MKHFKFPFHTLLMAMMCVVLMTAFSSCKSDDDSSENIAQIIIGTWAQDGDNDIMVLSNDGTGVWYDGPSEYNKNEVYYSFAWHISDDWLYFIDSYGEEQKMRPISVSKDKIVWKRYDQWTDEDDADGYDSFGFYTIWTWERYK